ncbi:MAG TPA: Gfo/Idh/MocA family oxidoreductase [Aquihabitans sp.]|jgi:saccharopine dehydrogenase-like NADP-dependent oxidoreductase|nr:Gfo/Idh/MocA family oxidoreductase [Aquihabitans sp.]
MRVAVVGLGAVGTRAARQLASTDAVTELALRDDRRPRIEEVASSLGPKARIELGPYASAPEADVVVLATPAGEQVDLARTLVARGTPVVSTSDAIDDVAALLDLGPEADARGVPLVVGAAFSPGLTCVLARFAADQLDTVDEIHVSRLGTGGPACARQHHRSLRGVAIDWRDGGWQRRPAGSGRELSWFPDPIGAADCYRAALPDALLLVPAFRGVGRVTARLAATRRDRLTSPLPMLRRPHPEAGLGAVRVEVRGRADDGIRVEILGAMDRPGVAGGAVAALAAVELGAGRARRVGAGGLAELVEAKPFLAELGRRGVKAARFG